MTRPLLLAAVLAVAPAASAQTDPGGASAPLPVAVSMADSDPGGGLSEALPAPSTVSDLDADAPQGTASTPVAIETVNDLNGRDPAAPTLRVEPISGERAEALADGRDPDVVVVADARAPAHDGPLLNGREGGDQSARTDEGRVADATGKTGAPSVGMSLSPVMPNPVRSRAAVTFAVEAAVTATVTVYDLTGRRIALAYEGAPPVGVETRVELDLSGLSSGTYVAVLDTGRERVSRTFQVVR